MFYKHTDQKLVVLSGFHAPHIGITALCKARQGSIVAPPNGLTDELRSTTPMVAND